MEHVNVLYPMLKAELFLRWDRDELPDVIERWQMRCNVRG